jgi:general secretion pathway protein H
MIRQDAIPPVSHFSKSRGFTLLELVVVLFLIGLLSGVTVLSIGDGGQEARFENEAARLETLLRLCAEESVIRGVETGVGLAEDGYHFFLRLDGAWKSMAGSVPFRRHQASNEINYGLLIGEKPVSLDPELEFVDAPIQLYFPTGESTPAVITINSPGISYRYLLRVDSTGVVNRVRDHDDL